jgi:hypothetical protein
MLEEIPHTASAIILPMEIKIQSIQLTAVQIAISKTIIYCLLVILIVGPEQGVTEGKVEYLQIIIMLKLHIQVVLVVLVVLVE